MSTADDRRELAPLDPSADPRRWEAMVQGINRAAAPEIARRGAMRESAVVYLLTEWRRPAAAVCGAIAAGAAAILLLQPPAGGAEPGLAGALGYPEALVEWVETEGNLSVEELLFALEAEQ
jgi:hypothetical protein